MGPPLVCAVCAAGMYQESDSVTLADTCTSCSAGRYALDHTFVGFDDSENKITAATFHDNAEEDCLFCEAGTQFSSTTTACSICEAGTYQHQNTAASVECSDCPTGRYLVDGGSTKDAHADVFQCLFCSAGTQFTVKTTLCSVCGAGKYQDQNTEASIECSDCPTGRYLVDVGTTALNHSSVAHCLFCGRGTYFVTPISVCTICAIGQYQSSATTASVACVNCPAGKNIFRDASTDKYMQWLLHDNLAQCVGCIAGQYLLSAVENCRVCPGGYYQKTTTGDVHNGKVVVACTACPAGKFIRDDGGDLDFHDEEKDCLGCQNGQFSSVGARFCQTCSAGKFGDAGGGTVAGVIVACVDCDIGKFQPNTGKASCRDCGKGRYGTQQGLAYCLPCIPGRFQVDEGQRLCSFCEVGQYLETLAGFQSTGLIGGCKHCPAGFQQTVPGSTNCIGCTPGKYYDGKHALLPDNIGAEFCQPCDGGKASKDSQSTVCDSCEAGRYVMSPGRDECKICDMGRYQDQTAQLTCKKCAKGQYSGPVVSISGIDLMAGKIGCDACPAGYEMSTTGGSACLECVPGRYFDGKNGSAARGGEQPTPGSHCSSCAPGQYTPVPMSSRCFLCDSGQFIENWGKSECKYCEKGQHQDQEGQESCKECLAGFFFDGQTQSSLPTKFCNKCVVGKSSKAGKSECKNCEKGQHQDQEGQESCKECLAGFFFDGQTRSAFCNECVAGKSSKAGSSVCDLCALGRYANEKGSEFCKSCAPGFFRDETRRTPSVCDACPAGYFSEKGAAITICSACDAGMFQEQTQQSACVSCPAGTFQDEKRATAVCKICPTGFVPVQATASTVCTKSPFKTPEECRPQVQYLDDSKEDRLEHECSECIVGADCSFSPSLSNLRPLEGFRPLRGKPNVYGRCPAGKKACPYVEPPLSPSMPLNLSCAAGHDSSSELCSVCLKGFAATTREEQCSKCPDSDTTNLLFAAAIFFALLVFCFLVWDNMDGASDMVPREHKTDHGVVEYSSEMPFHSIVIRIVSSYLQIAGMLLQFDLQLPKEVRTLITIESSSGALGEQLLLFDCGVELRDDMQMFLVKQIVSVWLFPFIGLIGCGLFWTLYHIRKRKEQELFFTATDGFVSSLMVLFFTLFPSLVNRLALSFSCQQYADVLLVTQALSVECFSEPHLQVVFAVGVPGIILFIVLIPGFLSWTLIRERKAGKLFGDQEHYDHDNTLRYGFVFAGYKPGWEWWESVIMARKCSFVMLAIFLRQYGPACQVVAASIVLVLALSAHLQTKPYHDSDHSRLESIGLHTCTLVLLATLLANLVGRETDLEGRDYLGPVSTVMLSIFVFGTTLYFFGEVVYTTIRASQHTKGAIGNAARGVAKCCGPRCKRLEDKAFKTIRIETRVRNSVLKLLHKKPAPSLNIEEHKKVHLPPMPQVQAGSGGSKVHPAKKARKWLPPKDVIKKNGIVQNVSKGLVKAIAAAEDTKRRVKVQQDKQHERLQKRIKIKHQQSLHRVASVKTK